MGVPPRPPLGVTPQTPKYGPALRASQPALRQFAPDRKNNHWYPVPCPVPGYDTQWAHSVSLELSRGLAKSNRGRPRIKNLNNLKNLKNLKIKIPRMNQKSNIRAGVARMRSTSSVLHWSKESGDSHFPWTAESWRHSTDKTCLVS